MTRHLENTYVSTVPSGNFNDLKFTWALILQNIVKIFAAYKSWKK